MKLLILMLLITVFTLSSPVVLAQTFKITEPGAGYGIPSSTHLGDILRNIITIFFTVGALGFTIMIIWASVDWILSGGDKEKIAGARKRITTAIIGLAILSLFFVILIVAGQITGIGSLNTGVFVFPGLGNTSLK